MQKIMRINILLFILVTFLYKVTGSFKHFRGHGIGYSLPPPVDTGRSKHSVITTYFSQYLDHYDSTSDERWLQKYSVNDNYFDSSNRNVAFLMIEGEGAASEGWVTSGAWVDFAEKYGAICFQLEHRFYGKSHPFSDVNNEHLGYLSSRQALADIATFISAMNKEYNLSDDVKWIAYGGSYAGSLAAWLREKYPHLVHGAVASSAPLNSQLDFPEYLQVVIDDLATHSQKCVDNLQEAIIQLDNSIINGDEDLNSLFTLCDDIEESVDNQLDLANLFEMIADNFAGIAQYNKLFGDPFDTDAVCEILNAETKGKELYRLAEVNNIILQRDGHNCFDYKYENLIKKFQDTTITTSGNMRQWIYQTCSEFGNYQTSNQEIPVFGKRFPLNFFIQQCIDIFGEKYNQTFVGDKVDETNVNYGGFNIKVTNVVFVHGSYDPWHVMGVWETRDPEAPAILINGTAHCADIYSASDNDIPELTSARNEVERLVGVWLGKL